MNLSDIVILLLSSLRLQAGFQAFILRSNCKVNVVCLHRAWIEVIVTSDESTSRLNGLEGYG